MPAKNAILPRFSSSTSTATAPACAIASTIRTPGITGRAGKCPGNHQSSARTSRRRDDLRPGTSSITSSSRRNGSRCGRMRSISSLPNGASGITPPSPPPEARASQHGPDGRSTSPCRPACRSRRDLLEREAERVLQHEHPCLGRRKLREAVAEIRAQLGELGLPIGRAARGHSHILVERVVASRAASLRDITAGVERQAMEPRRERGLAAELADLHAELRERVLRGVARVLGICEHVGGEATDAGRVAGTQRLEGVSVSVLGTSHENRVAEAVVRKLGLGPQRGTDSAACTQRSVARGESTDRRRERDAPLLRRPRPPDTALRQGRRHRADRISAVVGSPRLRGLFLAAVVVAVVLEVVVLEAGALAGGAPTAAAPHHVLVASLEDDINPVSQHYLQQQVRSPRPVATTRSSSSSTRPAASGARCARLSRHSSPRPCRSSCTSARPARVQTLPAPLSARPPTSSRWRRRRNRLVHPDHDERRRLLP